MSGGFLTGFQPPSESRHLTSSTQHWLVVYLPLWKMMEFVSWGYYSQLNGKIRKFNSTHLGKPAQPTQNATTTLDPPIQWEATWAFMVGSQGSPTAMAYIPWGLRQSLQCLCWAPAFVRKPHDFAFLKRFGKNNNAPVNCRNMLQVPVMIHKESPGSMYWHILQPL